MHPSVTIVDSVYTRPCELGHVQSLSIQELLQEHPRGLSDGIAMVRCMHFHDFSNSFRVEAAHALIEPAADY